MTAAFGVTLYVGLKAGFVRRSTAYTDSPARGRDWCPCGGAARRRSDFEAHQPEANDNHGDSGCHGLRKRGDRPGPRPVQHIADIVRSTDDTLGFFAAPTRGSGSPA